MLNDTLLERDRAGQPVRVGLVGAGQMGEGLVCQMEMMHGMKAFAVADVVPGRAAAAYREAGVAGDRIVETNEAGLAAQAISEGKRVASTDPSLPSQLAPIDIVVEATGVPEVGARVALDTILNGKHMLQMNVETDATVGYILRRMARSAGVVYTLTAGDEPGATMELYDFAHSLGFDVVCAGKGKNNPLDRQATPDTVAEQAARQQMNPKMLASFVDGTKTMVEMTSLGNAIGFVPDVRGMHGPEATPKSLAQIFIRQAEGGILGQDKVVEYARGVAPGVFVVFTTQQPKVARDLRYLKLGEGPYWALYRPYHLANLETPISIVRAVLKGETTIATDRLPIVEAITMAKRDLKAGEKIDSLGGFMVYGSIEKAAAARSEDLLPLGLAPGCNLVKDVPQGAAIHYADVELDPSLTIVHLRRLQDQMVQA
jgi:predicted homoserine dehydrogenase-like protein